ncbi:MAG: class I SAM-dependent methyltransferase [Desulfobacterales bacterium]|nr:class I SAM-dependent methyltransferase [Desulfobacterales bacterium]
MGKAHLEVFKTYGDLKAYESVLDVGCGCGLIGGSLTKYLIDGTYEGFDPDKTFIDWCKNNISSKYPNFHFSISEVAQYENPNAKVKSSKFVFPYKAESFDFVIVKSIFTHMLPEGVENYLFEINRVLKTGGRCFITYCLINDDSLKLIQQNKTTWNFKCNKGNYSIISEEAPLQMVAYNESFILELYNRIDLHIEKPIFYGGWRGKTRKDIRQDFIIAIKK